MKIEQDHKIHWRFRAFIVSSFFFILILVLVSCLKNDPKNGPIKDKAFVILTLGDDVMDFENPITHKRWPDYLQDFYDQKVSLNRDMIVLNRGLTALNTYGLLERIDRFLEADKPDLVLIQIGRINLYNRFGFGTFQFPYFPNPALPSSLLVSDTRDKFEKNNPFNSKYKNIFSFCFSPELKGDVKEALDFLQEQKDLSSEALVCLGNLQRFYLKDDELAFETYLQAWKKKTNLDLSYDALEPFFKICHSSEISTKQKIKCLWYMNVYSPVFWDSEYAEKKFQVSQHLCDWIEKDLYKLVKKLKTDAIPFAFVKYPISFEAKACDVNSVIEKVGQKEKVRTISLPGKLGLENRDMPKQTAEIVFQELKNVY